MIPAYDSIKAALRSRISRILTNAVSLGIVAATSIRIVSACPSLPKSKSCTAIAKVGCGQGKTPQGGILCRGPVGKTKPNKFSKTNNNAKKSNSVTLGKLIQCGTIWKSTKTGRGVLIPACIPLKPKSTKCTTNVNAVTQPYSQILRGTGKNCKPS